MKTLVFKKKEKPKMIFKKKTNPPKTRGSRYA